jgi:hypothetical protein
LIRSSDAGKGEFSVSGFDSLLLTVLVQLYTYREPADAPFDFCVRKVDPADDPDNHDWPFEFYNVREGGISYRAGVRDGDRVNAHCDYKESAQKKRRNWQDTTLEMLNDLSSETLRIIFVDKRIDLESEDDNIHMRKRRDFIAAKKVTSVDPTLT